MASYLKSFHTAPQFPNHGGELIGMLTGLRLADRFSWAFPQNVELLVQSHSTTVGIQTLICHILADHPKNSNLNRLHGPCIAQMQLLRHCRLHGSPLGGSMLVGLIGMIPLGDGTERKPTRVGMVGDPVGDICNSSCRTPSGFGKLLMRLDTGIRGGGPFCDPVLVVPEPPDDCDI